MMNVICREVDEYLKQARSSIVCNDQLLFCDLVDRCFKNENIHVDDDQLQRYLGNERYFEFSLFPWERAIFALHNCAYTEEGLLRWPILFVKVGRGSGKNGYLAFESFCLSTPINGVKNYNIDIFANSEDQAKTSPDDIREVLENNKSKLGKYFRWNKEIITNINTGSQIRFRTSGYKTKDGGRPGMVVFDEYHAYEDYRMIEVAKTGLGKKKFPRQTIITTDGYIRGGPLDDLDAQADAILSGEANDCGMLPFRCQLDKPDEVNDRKMWQKANPSLNYFPDLQQELELEYEQFKINPSASSSFMVKRMNVPAVAEENDVTSWENLKAAQHEFPDLTGCDCIGAIDYAKTTDFVSAGLLFKHKGNFVWMQHSWVCSQSIDIPRIKAPLKEWEEKGFLTFVEGPEISPDIPSDWLLEQSRKYSITSLGIDNFRYTLLAKSLKEHGFDCDKGGANNILLTKRVTQNRYAPVITSLFNTGKIWWNDPMMAWYTNNTCVLSDRGNQYYGKKEERSRKTDGFMALVSAICAKSEELNDSGVETSDEIQVFSF